MVAPETARLQSMSWHLRRGDILFDIGTEKGDVSVLYAEMVGAENMVLFEGEPLVWPNIREEWVRNGLPTPLAYYAGLVGEQTSAVTPDYDDTPIEGWPAHSYLTPTTHRTFRYIHDHASHTRMTTIDDWVKANKIIPTALTIDIEGAELLALRGAKEVLRVHRPWVWVSIHPDLMERDYESTPEELIGFMESLDYTGVHLGTDHEEHWWFS